MVARWSAGIAVVHVPVGVPGAGTTPHSPPSGAPNVIRRKGRSGTSSSFSEFYRTHVTYVWKTACRLGVTAVDVEDVVQETFLTAHRLGLVPEMQATERAWLFGIVYNVVQHHRRTHRRRTAHTEGGVN